MEQVLLQAVDGLLEAVLEAELILYVAVSEEAVETSEDLQAMSTPAAVVQEIKVQDMVDTPADPVSSLSDIEHNKYL